MVSHLALPQATPQICDALTYMCRLLLAGSSNSGWVDSFLKIIGLEDLVDTKYSKLGKLVCIHDRNIVPSSIISCNILHRSTRTFCHLTLTYPAQANLSENLLKMFTLYTLILRMQSKQWG